MEIGWVIPAVLTKNLEGFSYRISGNIKNKNFHEDPRLLV